jgi:hypothetical protein
VLSVHKMLMRGDGAKSLHQRSSTTKIGGRPVGRLPFFYGLYQRKLIDKITVAIALILG